ncbi:uncharacterized protein C16orf78 homolog isoform X2 [Bos indicus x Bos taurus]|uniref:uncharacterized protein C16orf78 homolog isoform X2 n=1 Tax=Bos indicus x Bos taurus TaxID=30522 RepID=UPI000F7D5685|nr:uncharacterized protein C16orf78 homolog isoform X2 [Bos indicus x Bos taurus]
MTEQSEDLKNSLPTERKLVWRSAEERRMSDLTRVLEWLERRQGKKKQALQKSKPKVVIASAEPAKEEKKTKTALKHQGARRRSQGNQQASGQNSKEDETSALYRRLYRVEAKGKRLSSLTPGTNPKDTPRRSDLDIKDAVAQESTQRPMQYRRQSVIEPVLQDTAFAQRKSTVFREWGGKIPDASYERKLKSLMEKGTEPKMEMMKMLKPEEVLSCRYLRLSKNNIRTLLKLCKDAGMNVDIHPHMIEGEIDAKKVFNQNISVAL